MIITCKYKYTNGNIEINIKGQDIQDRTGCEKVNYSISLFCYDFPIIFNFLLLFLCLPPLFKHELMPNCI